MDYRVHNRSGNKISLLGFGTMRFPIKTEGEKEIVDIKRTREIVDYAYKSGVNYFDTAYRYHDGQSELVIGEILSDYPRDTFFLADKMPTWSAKDVDTAKYIFADQLKRCRVDYFDYYLCHAVSKMEDYKRVYQEEGVYEYLYSEKQKGRIKNLGFSFHGNVGLFEYMINDHDWDFVQIQLNYMDWEAQDAKTLYRLASEKDIQCIIMEPVRGGALATLNEEAAEILKNAEPDMSVASWAIRYAAGFENVICVLSGMSNMEQTADNIKTLSGMKQLYPADYSVIQKALESYMSSNTIPCTACRYCMDCPAGVDIPGNFSIYNECASKKLITASVFEKEPGYKEKTQKFIGQFKKIPEKALPQACVDCKKCIDLCPQSIDIPKRLYGIRELICRYGG